MVVKDKVGRTRYIVFELQPGGFERSSLIRSLNRSSHNKGLRPSPRLTVFNGTRGIVRCGHRESTIALEVLQDIKEVAGTAVRVGTIVTSGTLRKAKEYL